MGSWRMVVAAGLMWAGAATAPAAEVAMAPTTESATRAAAERNAFGNAWASKVGLLPEGKEEAFIHELLASEDMKESRDDRVEHLRAALALRPEDPYNIVLEFKIGVMLQQNVDPAHHQGVRPKDALPYFQHIVEHYDHKAYYRPGRFGDSGGAAELLVPRAAILLAEPETTSSDKGEAYLDLAMQSLYWTFCTRTQEWAATPKPKPESEDDTWRSTQRRNPAAELAAWEKKKADAAAGKAVGPYEPTLAEAAVRVLLRRHRGGEQAALQSVMDRFPGSPLATAATAQAAGRGLSLRTARVATTAATTTSRQALATEPAARPAGAADTSSPGRGIRWVLAGSVAAIGIAALWLMARRGKR